MTTQTIAMLVAASVVATGAMSSIGTRSSSAIPAVSAPSVRSKAALILVPSVKTSGGAVLPGSPIVPTAPKASGG